MIKPKPHPFTKEEKDVISKQIKCIHSDKLNHEYKQLLSFREKIKDVSSRCRGERTLTNNSNP